ncbi:MAG: O-methyltransferase [Bacilli bacterium]|jgi:predicted O-methyltransferase YrrM|nr:O-methyltransferase [Bacilli bacterium]
MNQYLSELNKLPSKKIESQLRKYATDNKVPIVSESGLFYLLLLIQLLDAKNILEIGTAIAYSTIQMALLRPDIFIDTIEKSEEMAKIARDNIKNAKVEKQITLVQADALDYNEQDLKENYDLIFIDAAKAQYINFFEKYEKRLRKGGIIVSDNLLFHGLLTTKEKIDSRNLRALIRKIRDYNDWLSKNKKYDTQFLEIGDGMAVSLKK